MLNTEQIQHLAKLSRLELTNQEEEKFSKDLSSILDYFKKLSEVDTTSIEPMAQSIDLVNVFKEDKIVDCPSNIHDDILDNAPERSGDYVKTGKIL